MKENKIEKVLQFLQSNIVDIKPTLPRELPLEDHFVEIWGLDSLDLVEFVARIELEYKIEISDEDYKELYNMNKILDYMETRF